MDIDELREEIDGIDSQLLKLFFRRMQICGAIGEYKRENKLPVFDPAREEALLSRIEAESGELAPYSRRLYSQITEISKAYQRAQSGRFGLLGKKLSHSYSPEIQKSLGIKNYGLFEVPEDEIQNFFNTCGLDGFNVTVPYKQTVIPYLSEISDICRKTGAVNTVVIRGDKRYGYNTDYAGFSGLLDNAGFDVKGKKVLVLGSGGASKTVVCVCKDRGANTTVISRSGDDNYGNISKHFDADYIVNTTPVGMFPEQYGEILDLQGFTGLCGVVDLIYNPMKTPLLLQAEKRGITAVNGLSMLVIQAAESAGLFCGCPLFNRNTDKIIDGICKSMCNIILIGMPGCGKTTVGRVLSDLLNRPFYDTDAIVKEISGYTPSQLIENNGEEYFRAVETRAVKKACCMRGAVIATGGGAVCREENVNAMKSSGLVVLLMRDINELSTENRPLSIDLGKLAKIRRKLYRYACDAQIDVTDPETTAREIAGMFGKINLI